MARWRPHPSKIFCRPGGAQGRSHEIGLVFRPCRRFRAGRSLRLFAATCRLSNERTRPRSVVAAAGKGGKRRFPWAAGSGLRLRARAGCGTAGASRRGCRSARKKPPRDCWSRWRGGSPAGSLCGIQKALGGAFCIPHWPYASAGPALRGGEVHHACPVPGISGAGAPGHAWKFHEINPALLMAGKRSWMDGVAMAAPTIQDLRLRPGGGRSMPDIS